MQRATNPLHDSEAAKALKAMLVAWRPSLRLTAPAKMLMTSSQAYFWADQGLIKQRIV